MMIAGLDEVGWGAGAGPLVSVVAVLKETDHPFLPKGVTDSKKLTDKKRQMYFEQLCAACTDVGMGAVEPWEIDALGPKFALQESYKRAIAELRVTPDILIVDGTEHMNKVRSFKGQQQIEPKADLKHIQVSVASCIAKVFRDQVMEELAVKLQKLGLPSYNWAVNKGYFTADHQEAIMRHGLLFGPDHAHYFHRRSYCEKFLGKAKIYGQS